MKTHTSIAHRRTASIEASLIRSQFNSFVRHAFGKMHGKPLGDQPYIEYMCHTISKFIDGETTRLLINLPPQHLKSFVGTICLASYLLGNNPRLRIILVAYDDQFAESLCGKIRDMMQTAWYRAAFPTRIKDGHSRANDFATTDGGGIFAIAATGAVTGRAADVIIYDDPHQIGDWNKDRKLQVVRDAFNAILSRLSDKLQGRIIVIAHRVSDNDLSAELLQDRRWKCLRLPLVATKIKTFELGHDQWVRVKGDVLQPRAYPPAEISRLMRTQSPPYELFYQQGEGSQSSHRAKAEHFQLFASHEMPVAPVVLSIDPGLVGGPDASCSVIQAWKYSDARYFLVDQFREQCDFESLKSAFWRFVRRHRPSVALIENTANGPALHAAIRTKARFDVKAITAGRQSKGERLAAHMAKIRKGKILLPEDAFWRDAFIDEVVSFPSDFDDQIDAMTQYLAFMDTRPALKMPPPRALGAVSYWSGDMSGTPTTAAERSAYSNRSGNRGLGVAVHRPGWFQR